MGHKHGATYRRVLLRAHMYVSAPTNGPWLEERAALVSTKSYVVRTMLLSTRSSPPGVHACVSAALESEEYENPTQKELLTFPSGKGF